LAPTTDQLGLAGLVGDVDGKRSSRRQGMIIGFSVAGSILVVLVALYLLKPSKTKKSVSYDVEEEQIDPDVNEHWTLESLKSNNDDKSRLSIKQSMSIAKASSFIPADRKNLGANHTLKDVQCCGNFPCENCRMENNLTFVRVSKWKMFTTGRGNKSEDNNFCGKIVFSDSESTVSSQL
jgi:hypothetical protein